MDEEQWGSRVQKAASSGDAPVLRVLFDEAIEEWGRETALRRWQLALSGFDAAAITG